ncbi:hypothetical protein D3C85_1160030 [compost metagenome]
MQTNGSSLINISPAKICPEAPSIRLGIFPMIVAAPPICTDNNIAIRNGAGSSLIFLEATIIKGTMITTAIKLSNKAEMSAANRERLMISVKAFIRYFRTMELTR